MIKNIIMYLAVVNILAFICFGVDKQKAKTHQWRISEKTLLGIAVCGGSLCGDGLRSADCLYAGFCSGGQCRR